VPGLSASRGYLALLLIAVLWGSYPAMAKLALRDVPPVALAAIRCMIASAFLVVLLARAGAGTIREITPSAVGAFAVLALTGVVGSMQLTYLSLSIKRCSGRWPTCGGTAPSTSSARPCPPSS